MTNAHKIQPVIMSGGAGTRLWPMSRKAKPKQFLPLASDLTLFQETVRRVSGEGFLPPVVIGGAGHGALIAEQLSALGIKPAAIIAEPAPRNTAAVAAVAAGWAKQNAPGALVLLAPADHHVTDAAGFRALARAASAAAASGKIVTFGVRPTEPHTGFGYIEAGANLAGPVSAVATFREKPDRATAEAYLKSGRHFWNAGIFLYAPETMLAELETHALDIAKAAAAALRAGAERGGVFVLGKEEFEAAPADSVDYAVMEKTARAAVAAPAEFGWSDIGSWSALAGAKPGDPRVFALDAEGCVIETDGPFVGVVGVDDLVIVATGDAVLVAPKSRAQDVKKIVEELKKRGREDLV